MSLIRGLIPTIELDDPQALGCFVGMLDSGDQALFLLGLAGMDPMQFPYVRDGFASFTEAERGKIRDLLASLVLLFDTIEA